MASTIHSRQALQKIILLHFGTRIYKTEEHHDATRRFLLTRTKIQDILLACGPKAEPHECSKQLTDMTQHVHQAVSLAELHCFQKVARLGRCVLNKRGRDPSIFIDDTVLLFAQKLRAHYLHQPQTA